MLVLPIKKKWFDMILSGEKKEEYREIKPYYTSRFNKYMPRSTNFSKEKISPYFIIIFRNGYSHDSPSVKCKCILSQGEGVKEWGAVPKKQYYILRIEEILEIKNWDNSNAPNKKVAMAFAELPATAPITPSINDIQEEMIKAINKQIEIPSQIFNEENISGLMRRAAE